MTTILTIAAIIILAKVTLAVANLIDYGKKEGIVKT
jgi:hypothetical protein